MITRTRSDQDMHMSRSPFCRNHYSLSLMMLGLLLILSNAAKHNNSEFAEYPSDISLTESEMEAVFRCRHQSTEAFITWLVNGTSSGQFPVITTGSIRDNDNLVSTLTIPARSEYNGTEVVCEAYFLNGSPPESTFTVLLIITTDILATTAPQVRMVNNRFIEVPSPPVVIVTIEERHVYMCNNSAADRIIWRVNGSVLWIEIFPQSFDNSIIPFPDGGRVYTLTIGGRPEHNGTSIQCVASFNNGSNPEVTPIALFLIQGTLDSVTSLIRTDKMLTWTAPFSLDLINIDPDIIYCVELYNITCGRRDLIISDCNVTEPSYTSDNIAPDGYIYEYIITPRSNVEGARNGTSLTVTERFSTLSKSEMGYTISAINKTAALALGRTIADIDADVIVRLNMDVDQEAIIPASLLISLESLDGLTDHNGFIVPRVTAGSELNYIVMEIAPLAFRRLWNVTVFAHNCDDHPLIQKTELGTHDIYNISVISTRPGVVMVIGNVLDGSLSIGALIVVYSLTDNSNIFYKFAPRIPTQKQINLKIVVLPNSEYTVSAFVLEESGLPFNRVAAIPKLVPNIMTGTSQLGKGMMEIELSYIEYDIQSTSTGVCITCTFLDSSTTDCVAVVHQRISQLSSSGLMNIESSHRFNRSGDTAYGCIEGVDMKLYHVGIIGGINQKMKMSPEVYPWSILGAGVFLIASIGLVVVIFTAVYIVMNLKAKRNKLERGSQPRESAYRNDANDRSTTDIEMTKCGAYEVIQLSKQRPLMMDNPAYGEVGADVMNTEH